MYLENKTKRQRRPIGLLVNSSRSSTKKFDPLKVHSVKQRSIGVDRLQHRCKKSVDPMYKER